MNLLDELRRRFTQALLPLAADATELALLVKPVQDSRFGDYQANVAMPLAKRLGRALRQIADEILKALALSDLCEPPEIAGPGFINLKLRTDWIESILPSLRRDDRLGVAPVADPKTIVVDFSAPNVAKPMHVGHLRSSVLGAALDRMFRFAGHRVISDNHIGDWGTQFGMIIYGYKHFRDPDAYARDPVDELARLYRLVNQKSEADPAIAVEARLETARLHANDAENLRLWNEFLPHCLRALDGVYERLGVRFDQTLGESYYQPMLGDVVASLQGRGLATESEGALCVFVADNPAPFIIRKRDGAFTYATTDLATVRYRSETLHADMILYVVDARQSEHFRLLFATARQWGYDRIDYRHVSFGTILGEDKRPFKTRSGDTVGLESLLDEAVLRARQLVDENDDAREAPELDGPTRTAVAETVGIGGIKYADLRHNRESDYVFAWDKMLATTGDTATYIQYSFARICGIFRKGGIDRAAIRDGLASIQLRQPTERALALQLLRFPEAISLVLEDCRPNILAGYLFATANEFTRFYDECPVIKEPVEAVRDSRLLLCDLTARVLEKGLWLLGIQAAEQM